MKKTEIKAGTSYTNKSGRAERLVLDIGKHVRVRWFGSDSSEPIGEEGVLFIDSRMGKTLYGKGGGKRPSAMYLSAFSSWARYVVPRGFEASNYTSADIQKMIEEAV